MSVFTFELARLVSYQYIRVIFLSKREALYLIIYKQIAKSISFQTEKAAEISYRKSSASV